MEYRETWNYVVIYVSMWYKLLAFGNMEDEMSIFIFPIYREDESFSGGSKMMVNGLPYDRDATRISSSAGIPRAPTLSSTPISSQMSSTTPRRDFQRDSRNPTTPKPSNHGLDIKVAELRHTANRLGGATGRMPQDADTYGPAQTMAQSLMHTVMPPVYKLPPI